jgi:hypothetical protein
MTPSILLRNYSLRTGFSRVMIFYIPTAANTPYLVEKVDGPGGKVPD